MSSTTVSGSGSGGWKDLVIGVVFLVAIGTGFTGVVALAAALFAGH